MAIVCFVWMRENNSVLMLHCCPTSIRHESISMTPPLGTGGIMFAGCLSIRPTERPFWEVSGFGGWRWGLGGDAYFRRFASSSVQFLILSHIFVLVSRYELCIHKISTYLKEYRRCWQTSYIYKYICFRIPWWPVHVVFLYIHDEFLSQCVIHVSWCYMTDSCIAQSNLRIGAPFQL